MPDRSPTNHRQSPSFNFFEKEFDLINLKKLSKEMMSNSLMLLVAFAGNGVTEIGIAAY